MLLALQREQFVTHPGQHRRGFGSNRHISSRWMRWCEGCTAGTHLVITLPQLSNNPLVARGQLSESSGWLEDVARLRLVGPHMRRSGLAVCMMCCA
jgi:hypothetical protein